MPQVDNFVFYKLWLENIQTLPIEVQDKIIAEIVRYGTGFKSEYLDDPMVTAMVNFTRASIDKTKHDYALKVGGGKNSGRKKQLNDREVYDLAREGKTAIDISQITGLSYSAITKSLGWRERRNDNPEFLQE
jgi:hypothetical protein